MNNRLAMRAGSEPMKSTLMPPQSLEAEQALLGAILKDPDAISAVLELIESEGHFYSPKHRLIFRSIIDLYNASEPHDITMVAERLFTSGQLEQIGGRLYLVQLVEGVASTANVVSYAEIVLEKSTLRQLIQTTSEISKSCYALEKPAEELLDQAEATIFQISESRLRKGFVHIDEPFRQIFSRIDETPEDAGFVDGVASGYRELDTILEGLHNGDLIIVAGRPSMGKTALAMNIAEYVAVEQKKPVGIFSLEMSRESLVMRMLCGRARVNHRKVRSRRLNAQERRQLAQFGGVLAQAPIYIDDSAALSSLEMRAKARRLKSQHDLSLLVVDYIQLMHGSGGYENRQQEIAMISRSMKSLAKELHIPVVAISQLSRLVEQRGGQKRPQLSDLRESGAIEQDADVVMFVYREEYYMRHDDPKIREVEGRAEVIVAKQRNGPTDTANLSFIKEYTRFENLDPYHRELPTGADPVRRPETGPAGGSEPADSPF